MAWFGDGFSNLRGQISNFTKEVLSDVIDENHGGNESETIINSIQRVQELERLLEKQENEISNLKVENQDLLLKLRTADSRNNDGWNSVEFDGDHSTRWDDDGALFDVALDNSATSTGLDGSGGRDVELEALRKRLHRAHRDNQQVTDRNLELERKIKELTAILEKNGRKFPNQTQLEDQSEMIMKLKNHVERHEQEMKHLQTLLEKTQQEKNQLEINLTQIKERQAADEKIDANSVSAKEKEKNLTVKVAKLKHRLSEMKSERDTHLQQKDSLEEQLKESQAECKRQTESMLQLDDEHHLAIEQMMRQQKTLKDRIETLESELQSSLSKNQLLTQDSSIQTDELDSSITCSQPSQESFSQTENISIITSPSQTDIPDDTPIKIRQALNELISRVVLFPIPPEYISPDDIDNDGLAQARVLARLSAGLNWKKETLERKITELMQHSRNQEDECATLRGNFDALVKEVMSKEVEEHTETFGDGGLAPIPERGEEQEQRINALESENEVLREMRANLETEVNRLRSDVTDLEARLVDEKNLHIEYQNRANLSHEDAELHGIQAVAAMREELEQAKSQLDDELFASREETAAVRQQLEDIITEKTNLIATLDTTQKELEKVSTDRTELNEKVNHFLVQLEELERDFHEQREQLDNKKDECESLKLQLIEHSHYISDIEQIPILEKEKNQYQTQVQQFQNQLKELTTENQKRELEIENLNQSNNELVKSSLVNSNHMKELTKQLEESNNQIISLQNLIKILEEKSMENETNKEDKSKLEENMERMQNQILSNEAELQNLSIERKELMIALTNKHQESVQYHNEIQRLNTVLTKERSQLEERHQQLADTQEELLATKNRLLELETAAATASTTKLHVAEEESELTNLKESLIKEQARNVYLQNEIQELLEKESALSKELERLRTHLVSVEEAYTQEALASAQALTEAQTRAQAAEERIKNASTAYTSSNILAQQQVESLQSQVRSVTQQREELQGRLAQYEMDLQQQAQATANLQAVLEQFQRDKERDIIYATERLRGHLKGANEKREELLSEISALKVQIVELRDVKSNNHTLRDQLERKIEQAASLSEQVSNLKQELENTAEKINAANGEGKVDRNLIKNLMIGYLTAPPKNREQVLKIIGNVLEFNQEEKEKSGLDPLSDKNNANLQSLSEAFVRFLENESLPKPNLRLLPERPAAIPSPSPTNSTTEASAQVGHRRSPSLLLADVNMPQFPQIAPGRSSSTILKDVLKKS